jgi:hypothetical protein
MLERERLQTQTVEFYALKILADARVQYAAGQSGAVLGR